MLSNIYTCKMLLLLAMVQLNFYLCLESAPLSNLQRGTNDKEKKAPKSAHVIFRESQNFLIS